MIEWFDPHNIEPDNTEPTDDELRAASEFLEQIEIVHERDEGLKLSDGIKPQILTRDDLHIYRPMFKKYEPTEDGSQQGVIVEASIDVDLSMNLFNDMVRLVADLTGSTEVQVFYETLHREILRSEQPEPPVIRDHVDVEAALCLINDYKDSFISCGASNLCILFPEIDVQIQVDHTKTVIIRYGKTLYDNPELSSLIDLSLELLETEYGLELAKEGEPTVREDVVGGYLRLTTSFDHFLQSEKFIEKLFELPEAA